MPDQHPESLTLQPIGFIRTAMQQKFAAPHQASDRFARHGIIELLPGRGLDVALQDLAGFDRIWLLWWFHKNSTWRPKVLPPRGQAKRRGVFSTRSPHRPNPLGLTAVRLLGIDGLNVSIGECDLVDQTPILDIKPYLPEVDAFTDSKIGWLAEVEAQLALAPQFQVTFEPLALEQLAWLKARWQIEFVQRATTILERDPSPHRTRRISRRPDGTLRMGCGAWRLFFRINESVVNILRLECGYPHSALISPGFDRIPDREAQIEFNARWSSESSFNLCATSALKKDRPSM